MAKYLANDTEVKTLKNREVLEEYLQFRKRNDVWLFPACNECSVVGINQLSDQEINVEISQEIRTEAVQTNNLLLVYPENFKPSVLPIRYTAFGDLCNRAGLKGRTIELMHDKGKISALDPVIKGQWLSVGLSLNGNETKVLIRDEKISSMKSHEYQIFPEHIIVDVLEKNLKTDFPEISYQCGLVNHEYLTIDYLLNAEEMETDFKAKIENISGKTFDNFKVGIQLSTSDVGNSSVIVTPFLILNDAKVRLGNSKYIRHDTCNTIETFEKELTDIAAVFREAEDRIEELGNTNISYPGDCFMNIVDANKLPKVIAKEIVRDLETIVDVTAIDIYIALNDLVAAHYAQGTVSLTSFITESEQVAKLMYIDYATYDKKVYDAD